uniref:Expressed protein n=1 Tax=Echinococcus granulosus TaxID=6210 RepID=A0A068WPW0_ECHGR|nr:expressed protein [Echinococcus granulosus]
MGTPDGQSISPSPNSFPKQEENYNQEKCKGELVCYGQVFLQLHKNSMIVHPVEPKITSHRLVTRCLSSKRHRITSSEKKINCLR